MKKAVFITTGQPTTNPRLVKEAEILDRLGYDVKVICCFYQQWAQQFDDAIISRHPGMFIYCGGHPINNRLNYYQTRLRQKISVLFWKYVKAFYLPENAISRTHSEALSIAKKIKADIYIVHNLGALPAAVIAAKHNNAKVGYDAEDLHSGQFNSATDDGYLLNKYIEEKYFAQTNYFTAASPLIAVNYQRIYPFLRPVLLNNVFPKTDFPIHQNKTDRLKLLWFSQTIGADRGLEDIVKALGQCSKNVELHLVGQISDNDRNAFFQLAQLHQLEAHQLQIHPPVAPDQLLQFAADFDIGMATETGSTLNRDICLTNKIFTYIQCGLAIIASDTQAQTLFLKQYPESGLLFHNTDVTALAGCINTYAQRPDLLLKTRLHNYQLGQTQLNWESESKVFIDLVENTLN